MLTRSTIPNKKAPETEAKTVNDKPERNSPAKIVNKSVDYNEIHDTIFKFTNKKLEFTNGSRNNFVKLFSEYQNDFGVPQEVAVRYCVDKFTDTGFDGAEITKIIQGTYKSHADKFGTKKFHPKNENVFLIRTANQCITDAEGKPNPDQLCSEFWHEGEVCILFAGAGVGKSLLSVQIGDAITRGIYSEFFRMQSPAQGVLYFDFELSEKQFQKRYSDQYRNVYQFRESFYRAEIDPDAENFSDENLYFSIEEAIKRTGSKILIMDNITYLKSNLEEGKHALPLMKYLRQLKKRLGLSILVLAHTPKRDQTRQMTINDLAGSSQLANFADAIFCINTSAKDKSIRYLKQIKARNTEIIYDADNVALFEIRNEGNFTGFHFLDFDKEQTHLKEISDKEKNRTETAIIELHAVGKSYRQIAADLNVSRAKVERTIKKTVSKRDSETVINYYESDT